MSLAVLDHEQNQKPRLRKTEFRPAHTEPATDSLSQSSRATSRSTLTRDQSESSISGKKKHKNRKSGRGHAIAVLLQVFAPNAPQAARWAASECDCLGECSCEVSPTETFAAEMVVPTEPDDYASSTTLKHSDVQRPPPKAGFARPLHHSIRNTTLSTGQDARQNGESTKPPNSTLPSCDRPSGRPWYERKRSSQQDLPTLDTFQSPKRPRTTESNLRSTLQNLGTDDSPRVIITAPKLQQHMINEPRDHNGERLKLPPLAMSSPSSTTSNTSPLARPVLPSLDSATSHPGSMSSARSRTLSTSSITTATTATSDLTPFHHPNSRTRSSSFADPSAITPASSSLLSSPSYFPPGAVHGRRTLAPAQPPPTLHKHTSSMTGTASAGSAPSLTHNESSISTPDAVTPNRTDAPSTSAPRLISIAKKPSDEDDASMSSHIPYQQVAAGYQCLYEGCDTVPFPTMYTFSSHTKKHTHDRPYYCPKPSCPRSLNGRHGKPGSGKGFKRKNEMVRHGLTHETPGYPCPWCANLAFGVFGGGLNGEQQKAYPRPDNLLRHVKEHHKDRSADDPQLREILARRIGPVQVRGRKKRVESDVSRSGVDGVGSKGTGKVT